MAGKLVDPGRLPTQTFDWGLIKPLVAAEDTQGAGLSLLHVVLLPGLGHERHDQPDADEILSVLGGEGEQMLDDGELPGYREVPPGSAPSLIREEGVS